MSVPCQERQCGTDVLWTRSCHAASKLSMVSRILGWFATWPKCDEITILSCFSVFSWVLFTLSDIKHLKERQVLEFKLGVDATGCDLRHVGQVPTLCQALDTIFLHCKCQWLQRFSPIPSMQPSSFPCEIPSLAATQHWTICHGGMWCGRVEKGGICRDLYQLKFGVVESLKSFEIPIWGVVIFVFWGGILWSICVCVSLIGFAAFSAFAPSAFVL